MCMLGYRFIACFYDLSLTFWKCFGSAVILVFHFISYLSFDPCICTCACFHERVKSQHHSFILIDITQQAPCMEQ